MSLRLALVGAGRMGRVHLHALHDAKRVTAVAVADPVADARAATGLPGHATVDELLAGDGFDAVLIAAPTDLHLELVTRIAGAGVPILCEKPCGLTAAETAAAAAAAEAAGIVLQIGYWRRFVPELQQLRGMVEAGELGEPGMIISHQWDELPPSAEFRLRSGGIAIDMAVHEIDQIRWLLGQEFGDVTAIAGPPPVDAPAGDADVAVAVSRLSGGTVAMVTLGRRFPPGDSCWVELFASDAHVRSKFMWGETTGFTAALAAQADAFADAVEGAPQRGASGADAVSALRTAERIREELSR
jgi:myo-inositol 2-dehydrogenase/D-chiro-inositol 1-dehydrogenase